LVSSRTTMIVGVTAFLTPLLGLTQNFLFYLSGALISLIICLYTSWAFGSLKSRDFSYPLSIFFSSSLGNLISIFYVLPLNLALFGYIALFTSFIPTLIFFILYIKGLKLNINPRLLFNSNKMLIPLSILFLAAIIGRLAENLYQQVSIYVAFVIAAILIDIYLGEGKKEGA